MGPRAPDAPTGASLLTEEEQRSWYLSVRQDLVDCEGLDPLLLVTLALGEARLRSSTLYGDWMMRHVGRVVGAGDDAEMTAEQLGAVARLAMNRFRLCPVRPVQRSSALGGAPLPRVVVREAKKAAAIDRFLDQCDAKGVGWCCPSLVQVKYPSGARVHEMHSHPSECLIWCRDVVMDRARTALVLMEVPNRLQMLHCFYVDWDMVVDDFTFDSEPEAWGSPLGTEARVEYVRGVAMGTPAVICELLAEAGYVARGQVVQVVVVEGTRGKKVGIHFVFKTMATREMHRDAWSAVLAGIEARVGRDRFQEVMRKRDEHVVDAESMRDMGAGLFCLIGMDMHPMQTIEQGLALPFSRKNPDDPLSRPVAIIHVEAGRGELFWEVPCRRVWVAGTSVRGPHPDVPSDCSPLMVLASLLDASICIPGPRCIPLADPGCAPSTPPPAGGAPLCLLDESSTCSTSSLFSTVATWPADPWGQKCGWGARGAEPTLRERAAALWERAGGAPPRQRAPRDHARPSPLGASQDDSNGAGEGRYGEPCSIPAWFLDAARAACPGFDASLYMTPRYGSRPSCAPRGGRLFQVNKSPVSMCVWEACRVPFSGFRAHTSNGTLFYVDGNEVYASCMSKSCHARHLVDRERNAHLARRVERLILHGDDAACTPQEVSSRPHVAECLREQDVDFLASVAAEFSRVGRKRGRDARARQFDLGCHDFWHAPTPEPQAPTPPPTLPTFVAPRGFVPVPACRRARDRGRRAAASPPTSGGSGGGACACACLASGAACASEYVGVPSADRWNALDGARTWVRVTPGLLDAHLRSVAGGAARHAGGI